MSIHFTVALAVFLLTSVRAGRVVLALDALQLGAQPLQVGILAATFSVLPMLCSWQAGKLADRYGSRWPLMLGAACGACGNNPISVASNTPKPAGTLLARPARMLST